MLDYVKIEEDETRAVYEFYVEGDHSQAGRVNYDKETGEATLLDENPDFPRRWCAGKLMGALEEHADALEPSGTLMWY